MAKEEEMRWNRQNIIFSLTWNYDNSVTCQRIARQLVTAKTDSWYLSI
jgi:hypothetical protein